MRISLADPWWAFAAILGVVIAVWYSAGFSPMKWFVIGGWFALTLREVVNYRNGGDTQ